MWCMNSKLNYVSVYTFEQEFSIIFRGIIFNFFITGIFTIRILQIRKNKL